MHDQRLQKIPLLPNLGNAKEIIGLGVDDTEWNSDEAGKEGVGLKQVQKKLIVTVVQHNFISANHAFARARS